MYALLMNEVFVPQEHFVLHLANAPDRQPIRTMGTGLLDYEKCPYSGFLRQTLLTCLAWDPADRPTARQLLVLCRQALDTLTADPSAPLEANLSADAGICQKLQPDPNRRVLFAQPRHIGETHLGPGPDIDDLDLSQWFSAALKFSTNPLWDPLPPSPPPVHASVQNPHGFDLAVERNQERVIQGDGGGQGTSNQINAGSKGQDEDDNLPFQAAQGGPDVEVQGRHYVPGAVGAKSEPAAEVEAVDVSPTEAFLRVIAVAEGLTFGRFGIRSEQF